jgi:hypothetical protein
MVQTILVLAVALAPVVLARLVAVVAVVDRVGAVAAAEPAVLI